MPTPPTQQESTIVAITEAEIRDFDGKLKEFETSLDPGERAAWRRVLVRAASVETDASDEILLDGVIMGEREIQDGVIMGEREIQDGLIMGERGIRDAVVRAAGGGSKEIGPKQDDPHAIGPKQDDPRAIGPKQDDPHAIGPKQDDPAPAPEALGRRIHALQTSLTPGERGLVFWLLARAGRASSSSGRPGTPGGLEITLQEALLVEPKGGGGGAPGPVRARSWRLRF